MLFIDLVESSRASNVDSADKVAVDWGESRTGFEERYRTRLSDAARRGAGFSASGPGDLGGVPLCPVP
jgi:hypothetical protein